MKGKKLSHSLRKHIRREKGRIRRETPDFQTAEKLISELIEKLRPRAGKLDISPVLL